MATGGPCAISLHSTSDYRPNDRRSYLKFSLWRRHWSTNKTTAKEWCTIPLIECVYAPHRETNSRLSSRRCNMKHRRAMCRVSCYRRLQRNVLLAAVALGRPTVIMVPCIPAVSVPFQCRWVLLLSLMWAVETEDDCFRYMCTVSGLVSKHFLGLTLPTSQSPCTVFVYRNEPCTASAAAFYIRQWTSLYQVV